VGCNFFGGEIVVDHNSDSSARPIAYISVFFENVEVAKCGIAFSIKIGFLKTYNCGVVVFDY